MYVIGREGYLNQSHTWYLGQNNDPHHFNSPQFTAQRGWKLEGKLQIYLKRYIKKYIITHLKLCLASASHNFKWVITTYICLICHQTFAILPNNSDLNGL